jgi:hypothetical protein
LLVDVLSQFWYDYPYTGTETDMARKRRPRLKKPTVQIATKYPLDLYERLQALAESRRVYASQIIRDAVVGYLAQQRADTQAGTAPAGIDTAPQVEAVAGGMTQEDS